MKIKINPRPLENIEIISGRWLIVLQFPIRTSFKYEICWYESEKIPISDFWMRMQLPIIVCRKKFSEYIFEQLEELEEDDIYIVDEEDIDEDEDDEW